MKKAVLLTTLFFISCMPMPFQQLSPDVGVKQLVYRSGTFFYITETTIKNTGTEPLRLKIICGFGDTEKYWWIDLTPQEQKTIVHRSPAPPEGLNVFCEYSKK